MNRINNSDATSFDEVQTKKSGAQNLKELSLISMIQEQHQRWISSSSGMRNQWRVNAMFARGFQWVVMNTVDGRILVPRPPPGRERLVINLMKPWLQDTEAKLDIVTPAFDVTPNTLAQDDKDAAVAGEGVGQHYWRFLRIRKRYREIVRHCLHFGCSFGYLYWDDTIGPRFKRRVVGQSGALVQADGSELWEFETEGDLRLDIYSPFNVFSDELPGELDAKSFVCLTSWMSLDAIRERWEEGKNVEAEAHASPLNDAQTALRYMATTVGNSLVTHKSESDAPGANVLQWVMKPQRSAPEGLIVVMANGVILRRERWPDVYSKLTGYPIVQFDWYMHPLQNRGTSPLEDQIPIQREINRTASQIIENKNSMLALKWMNPIGSGVEDIDDLAGQIIDYHPGFEPHIAQPAPLPQYVFRHLQDLMMMLEDVQILHKPSKGQVPAGVKSGVGIELLQEQDDRPLSTPEADLHEQLNLLMRKVLQIASVGVKTDRMIRYIGPNRRRQVMAFKGTDLRDNTDIHLSVVGGSSKSKAGVIKKILEFAQMGMYRDPQGRVDTRRIMNMMRQAVPDVIYEEEDIHEELQRDENDLMWDGGRPIPQEWERHDIHLEVIESEMNTMKWKQRAQQDKMWAQTWIAHREMHVILFEQAGQPQMGALSANPNGGTNAISGAVPQAR